MQGRKFMISATRNALREAFDNPNGQLYGGKGTADLFLHITSNYKFCGYDILPAFGIFDIFKNPDVTGALEDYNRHLEKHCL
jgi:modulator of drug activity B